MRQEARPIEFTNGRAHFYGKKKLDRCYFFLIMNMNWHLHPDRCNPASSSYCQMCIFKRQKSNITNIAASTANCAEDTCNQSHATQTYSWFETIAYHSLEQGSPDSVLERRCPAEFSSNLPQHHLPGHLYLARPWLADSGVFKLCRTPALQDQVWWPLH